VYSPPVWPGFPPPKAPNIWTSLTPLNCHTSILHTLPLCWTTENRGDMLTGVINLRRLTSSKVRLNAALRRQKSQPKLAR